MKNHLVERGASGSFALPAINQLLKLLNYARLLDSDDALRGHAPDRCPPNVLIL